MFAFLLRRPWIEGTSFGTLGTILPFTDPTKLSRGEGGAAVSQYVGHKHPPTRIALPVSLSTRPASAKLRDVRNRVILIVN